MPRLWIDGPEHWKHSMLGMVRDTTLGIVGVGPIGLALATKALALGMRVQALRRSDTALPVPGIERATSLGAMFAQCDHVVLAAPATRETQHMVNAEVLAQAKRGLHLINIGRGALIDQEALLIALDAGAIARATLDVTEPEPLPASHWLIGHLRLHPRGADREGETQPGALRGRAGSRRPYPGRVRLRAAAASSARLVAASRPSPSGRAFESAQRSSGTAN